MNIYVLKYFITIAEYRNFTKAADALYVTQPTLSRQIDLLEKEIGIKLFVRNSHSVSLTPAGTVFLEEAKAVMNRYNKMSLRMESIKRGITHTLNIGYTGTICYDVLSDALRNIYKSNPQMHISMIQNESSELNKNVLNGNLDIIFTLKLERKRDGTLAWRTAEKGRLLCLVNDEHILAKREIIGVEDLADERIIFPPRVTCPILIDYIISLFHKKDIEPNIMTIQQQQDIRFFVKSGFGVALMTDCPKEGRSSGVRGLPVRESNDKFDVTVTWKEGNDNPSVQILLNEIKQQVSDTDSSD